MHEPFVSLIRDTVAEIPNLSHQTCDVSLCSFVSALFHNNCMYLAHRLVTLGHEYSSRFPVVLKSHTCTFIDQVTVLRELGTSVFLKFMQGQRKQILDILRDSGEIYFSYICMSIHIFNLILSHAINGFPADQKLPCFYRI
jgi:hypothetical protein